MTFKCADQQKNVFPSTKPPTEIQGQAPEVSVVTYDEEVAEVHAIPVVENAVWVDEDEGVQQQQQYQHQRPAQKRPATAMDDGNGFDCLLCGDKKMRQLTAGRHYTVQLCGNTYIDLLDCRYPPDTEITLINMRLCGDTKLIVPPGTRVVVRRFLLCGNRDIYVENPDDEDPEYTPPRLTVYIFSLCGDVRVRSDREGWGSWFRRMF